VKILRYLSYRGTTKYPVGYDFSIWVDRSNTTRW